MVVSAGPTSQKAEAWYVPSGILRKSLLTIQRISQPRQNSSSTGGTSNVQGKRVRRARNQKLCFRPAGMELAAAPVRAFWNTQEWR